MDRRSRAVCGLGLALVLFVATPAYGAIDGFVLEGITAESDGLVLDSRIGKTRGEETHVINIADCEAYRGHTIRVSWGLTIGPFAGEEYSIKLAMPGGTCPLTDLDDGGDADGTCREIVLKRRTPTANGNTFDLDLDDITGGDCAANTDKITTVYIVYLGDDNQVMNQPIDFQVDLQPPAAPQAVQAFPGEASVRVDWEDTVNTESDVTYRVYYRVDQPVVDADSATGSATTGADARSLRVTGLDTDKTYYFRVAAIDENDNEGALSAELDVFATTVPVTDFWEHYKDQGGAEEGGFCFIATAAHGSMLEPQVVALREFRDRYLMTNPLGRAVVATYYALSPPFAYAIRDSAALRAVSRLVLAPVVAAAWLFVVLGPLGFLLAVVVAGVVGHAVRRVARRRFAPLGTPWRPLPVALPAPLDSPQHPEDRAR